MLNFFRIEANAALLLMVSALAGFSLANSPLANPWMAIWQSSIGLPWLNLSLANFIGEFLMAGFFLLVGIELKREWLEGVFTDRKSLLRPTLAAALGAALPAAIYLWLNSTSAATSSGWAIPMPTDLTFSLAVFAVFGRGWPTSARVFILAFAVIDDLIAVVVIALSSLDHLQPIWLLGCAILVAGFALLAKTQRAWVLTCIGVLAWYLMFRGGVQPAIIGAALGLFLGSRQLHKTEQKLHLWVAIGVLPVFALASTSIQLDAAFKLDDTLTLAIALRPLGKVIGITLGAVLATALVRNDRFSDLRWFDFLAISSLGGIGFSVSILIANQVFGQASPLANQAIVSTLVATMASVALAALALSARARLGGFAKR